MCLEYFAIPESKMITKELGENLKILLLPANIIKRDKIRQ